MLRRFKIHSNPFCDCAIAIVEMANVGIKEPRMSVPTSKASATPIFACIASRLLDKPVLSKISKSPMANRRARIDPSHVYYEDRELSKASATSLSCILCQSHSILIDW